MTPACDIERIRTEVVQHYHVDPRDVSFIFAPYRICPLGAHIDHQHGLVTAMGLDFGVTLAYVSLPTPEARIRSLDFQGEVRFQFRDVPDRQDGDWGNYLRGAVRALQLRGQLRHGIAGVTQGAVGEGGLSSSAAIGVAYLLALEQANGLHVTPEENIVLDQFIENTYLGLRNGILDQSAILLAREGELTLIRCANARYEHVPAPTCMPPYEILVAFSGLQQALVSTDYNRRVTECAEAARVLLDAAGRPGEQPLLGNVTDEEYARHGRLLNGPPARRARHFFSELARVHLGVQAWQRGNLEEFGRLITESGVSSIRNYECGSPPLVALYERLVETEGIYGARFSGAGFRGCCLAFAEPEKVEAAAEEVRHGYAVQFPDLASRARMMICRSGDGARWIAD